MPELPEVETIVQGLRNKIINKKIVDVEVCYKHIVQGEVAKFKKMLKGNCFKSIERRAKLLILEIASDCHPPEKEDPGRPLNGLDSRFRGNDMTYHCGLLLIHLKMTGQLIYLYDHRVVAGGHRLPPELPPLPSKHTRVIFSFADKSRLFFNDLRKFGYMKIVDEETKNKIESLYGVEPLSEEFTLKKLKEIIVARKSGDIKKLLMEQETIAGIGNIYSDEICFCARARPDRKISTLKSREIRALHQCVGRVLRLAIKRKGTTFSDFVNVEGGRGGFSSFLKVYDREGEKCLRCGGILKKQKVAGRGSVFCSSCQK